MSKFLIFVGMTLGGWLGWWLGGFFNITAALILSGVFTIVGVFVARWVDRAYIE